MQIGLEKPSHPWDHVIPRSIQLHKMSGTLSDDTSEQRLGTTLEPKIAIPMRGGASLPDHLLLDCFELACALPDEATLSTHGGKLVGWQSYEMIAPLALVCRAWYEAARDGLYASVAILTPRAADLILRTAIENPRLIERVKYLVIGLGDDDTQVDGGESAASVSEKLVRIITLCVNLRHLQVRPLHESAREKCLAAILSRQLLSLVCSPRLCRPDVGWTTEFFRKTDIDELALPSLHALELDAWTAAAVAPSTTPVIPHFSPCPIVNLRLHFVMHDDMLFALLSAAGPTLQVVDIYLEHILSLEQTVAALRASSKTMRNFRYVSNPTINALTELQPTTFPLFDQLLPHYENLEVLSVSATEISIQAFRNLPTSLRILDIISFNHQATFISHPDFLDILHDHNNPISLTKFSLSDSAEAWEPDYLEALRKAFLARGVIFIFRTDPDDL